MAAAYQPSEGFYAVLSLFSDYELTSLAEDRSFCKLHTEAINRFQTEPNLFMSAVNKTGFTNSMRLDNKKPDKQKAVMDSLASAYNGVITTRNNVNVAKGPPAAVFLTGNTWPDEVKKFQIKAWDMADYNSSDVILKYNGRIPHYVGMSLKEKKTEKAANPPLINNAFSKFISDNPKLVERIDDHRKKFFAGVIQEASQPGGILSNIIIPGNGSGKQGKLISELDLNNKQHVEDIWSSKVAIWKNGKQEMLPLINLKRPEDLVDRAGIMDGVDDSSSITDFRKFVNTRLQSSDEMNPLFQGFLNIMREKKVKDTIANSLLNRVLKLDMYDELDTWTENDFSFYLLVLVGQTTSAGASYQAHGQIESLASLLVAVASVAKGEANLVIDEKATKAASAAKVFFNLYKGDVGILTVELRYGGNFKGYPRFHANMHPDFLKRVGKAKIVLKDVPQ
tara:strand:- start:74 stop:1426 length:1353 start_codon:yes stop_codon:yes gene_type:complete